MKSDRRKFIKSICVLAGGSLLLGSEVQAFEKPKNKKIRKEEKQCTAIYCRYNNKGNCVNHNHF